MSRLVSAALFVFAACGAPEARLPPIEPVLAELSPLDPDTAQALRLTVPAEWNLRDSACKFTFRAPSDLSKQSVQGFDSCIGFYTSGTIKLSFDYGRYSVRFGSDMAEYEETEVLIDGKYGKLFSFRDESRYVVAVFIPRATATNKLTMWAECQDGAAADNVRAIISTIDFE